MKNPSLRRTLRTATLAVSFGLVSTLLSACCSTDCCSDCQEDEVVAYQLEGCLLMPEVPVGEGSVTRVHDGYELMFCCDGCAEAFDADPDGFLVEYKEALAARD